MDDSLKNSLQNKVVDNYDKFITIEVNGISFDAMPIKRDIPEIEYVKLDPDKNHMEIRFVSKNFESKRISQNDYITYLLDNEENVIGFLIKNLKTLLLNSNSKNLKSRLNRNIKDRLKIKSTMKEAVQNNLERRNLRSIKEFLLEEADDLELI